MKKILLPLICVLIGLIIGWSAGIGRKEKPPTPEEVRQSFLASDEPLIPAPLNRLLHKIKGGMTVGEIEILLSTEYPNTKGQMSNWSGQTGYIDYDLGGRYYLSVASITKGDERLVHDDLLFYVVEMSAGHRVDIKSYFWNSPAQKGGKFIGQ